MAAFVFFKNSSMIYLSLISFFVLLPSSIAAQQMFSPGMQSASPMGSMPSFQINPEEHAELTCARLKNPKIPQNVKDYSIQNIENVLSVFRDQSNKPLIYESYLLVKERDCY